MNLVFLEAPNKVAKVKKLLDENFNDNFKVIATVGHFMKLSDTGVYGSGMDENYDAIYEWDKSNDFHKKYLNEIMKSLETVQKIYLATDPDREGEVIASHLYSIIPARYKNKVVRISFNEITKTAIKNAINTPSSLDNGLVQAGKTRAVFDKLFGYRASRYAKATTNASSVGRVQGVVVLLLKEREDEIKNWVPIYKQKIVACVFDESNPNIVAKLVNVNENNEPIEFEDNEIINEVDNNLKCIDIKELETKYNHPPKPYITSSLLKDILNKFKISTANATIVLQKLYGLGLINYPRTDSYSLSDDFKKELVTYAKSNYANLVRDSFVEYKNKVSAQEGHECLRITHLNNDEINEELSKLDNLQTNIYEMIRKNMLAQVLIDNQVARVDYFFRNNQNKLFKLRAQKDIVLGWKTLYRNEDILESIVDENDDNTDINKVYKFYIENIYKADIKIERFIKNPCPKLYKESDIIKILEQKEIGRPSTYASYSSIVLNRNYAILNDKKQLILTELGNKLADVCIVNFKYFINYDFTKTFENELDKIAKNKTDYHAYLKQLDNEYWNL